MQVSTSERQEAVENLSYQLKALSSTDLTPVAEMKVINLIKCCRSAERFHLPEHFKSNILKQMVFLCYEKGIADGEIVAKVLDYVYEWCRGHYRGQKLVRFIWSCATNVVDCVFDRHLTRNVGPTFFYILCLNGTIESLSSDTITCRYVITHLYRDESDLGLYGHVPYYLKHTTLKRLTFGGRRLTELLCDADLRFLYVLHLTREYRCALIIELLQHGGSFEVDGCHSHGRVHYFVLDLISDIVYYLICKGHWDTEDHRLTVPLADLDAEVKSMCHCFRLLMKADSNPYNTTSNICRMEYRRKVFRVYEAEYARFQMPEIGELRLLYNALFPSKGFGYWKPPSLQHTCRSVIRKRLNENWQLPYGVERTGLPRIICDYIKLAGLKKRWTLWQSS